MAFLNADNKPHTLMDAALELVWPTRCSGCESPGALLCDSCKARLNHVPQEFACTSCGAPAGRLICTECYSSSGKEEYSFAAAVCCVELDELSGRVIVLYKDHNEHRLSKVFARSLLDVLPASWLAWADVLTWIPADKKAFRRRGFDHMERIAKDLAQIANLPAQSLLDKHTCRDQRGLNRSQRSENLKESFTLHIPAGPAAPATQALQQNPTTPAKPAAPATETTPPTPATTLPPHILLIDDVFTTGSTLNAAAARLKEGGALEVRVASVARAW